MTKARSKRKGQDPAPPVIEFTDEQKALLRSRWWRLNNLYKIQDKDGKVVTFKPNRVQRRLIERMWHRNIVPKSRQHGISTFACILALDIALWRPNSPCGIVTLTKTDAKKLFEKITFAYDNLPDWVRTARPYRTRDQTGAMTLENGSSINVSVSHRGGTLYFLHISEYGPLCALQPKKAEEVKTGALNTLTPDGIATIESTAYGSTGDFFEKCEDAKELMRMVEAGERRMSKLDYQFHFFAWYEDPGNVLDPDTVTVSRDLKAYFDSLEATLGIKLSPAQRAWYTVKAREQKDKMKREHPSTPEEAFQASVEGSYYGEMLAEAEAEGRVCELPLIPSLPVNTFWDLGRNDTTAIWFHQRVGPWHHFIDYEEDSGKQLDYYARRLIEIKADRGLIYGRHFLPHDGSNIDLSSTGNRTRAQVLNDLGIAPTVIVPRIMDIMEGIRLVRENLPLAKFDKDRCGKRTTGRVRGGIPSLKNYTKQWNPTTEAFHEHPLHNWASNGADAFRQWAQGYMARADQYDSLMTDEARRAIARRRNQQPRRSWKV